MKPEATTRASRRLRGAALAPALLAAACNPGPTGIGGPAPEPITELPRPLSTVEHRVVGASNTFAFELAREILPRGPAENLFFSPLSASMLLGMLLNGADGDTYTQIRSALAFDGLSQEEINDAYRDLTALLLSLDPTVTVEVGNSVWAGRGLPVLPDFTARVTDAFAATTEEVDFADPATLPRINRWASDATNGLIEEIFDRLPANVAMVLLNAIYFKADWTDRFDRSRTERAPFTRSDGSQVTVDLMYREGSALVGRVGGATLVELPYGGEAFSMVVALPDEGSSPGALLESLDGEAWDAWTGSIGEGRAFIRLPRFELEWEAELNDALMALGITDAFGPADFSRLTPGGGVWLDLVKQKAFVRVDEEGTEAAAVTGGVMVVSMPPEIRFDRPFLFAIRERLTGAVLFMGIVNDPTA